MSRSLFAKCLFIACLVMMPLILGHVPACSADKTDKAAVSPSGQRLPRLVDVGADQCIPCKMMAPVLAELKKEYAGSLDVVFIDVWKNPGANDKYKVRGIPTQIFYDAEGKERYRHLGYMSKEGILKTLKELNIPVKKVDEK